MTPTDLLIFALGAGLGLCVGWMLGSIAGHRMARAERNPVRVTRTQRVFLPTDYPDELDYLDELNYLDELDPSCVMPPPAPEPTDWEDFEQRTALREEIEAARPAGGLGYRDRPRGFGY